MTHSIRNQNIAKLKLPIIICPDLGYNKTQALRDEGFFLVAQFLEVAPNSVKPMRPTLKKSLIIMDNFFKNTLPANYQMGSQPQGVFTELRHNFIKTMQADYKQAERMDERLRIIHPYINALRNTARLIEN